MIPHPWMSGFTPLVWPLMFFFGQSPWPTPDLVVSPAAILPMILVMVGWHRFALPTDPCRTCCLKQLFERDSSVFGHAQAGRASMPS